MCMCDCVANMAVVHALHFQNSYYKLYCLVHCFKSGTLAILKVAFWIENSWFRVHTEEDENRLKDFYLMPWYGAIRIKVSFTFSIGCSLFNCSTNTFQLDDVSAYIFQKANHFRSNFSFDLIWFCTMIVETFKHFFFFLLLSVLKCTYIFLRQCSEHFKSLWNDRQGAIPE